MAEPSLTVHQEGTRKGIKRLKFWAGFTAFLSTVMYMGAAPGADIVGTCVVMWILALVMWLLALAGSWWHHG